jgi:hypothetical protein
MDLLVALAMMRPCSSAASVGVSEVLAAPVVPLVPGQLVIHPLGNFDIRKCGPFGGGRHGERAAGADSSNSDHPHIHAVLWLLDQVCSGLHKLGQVRSWFHPRHLQALDGIFNLLAPFFGMSGGSCACVQPRFVLLSIHAHQV